MNLLLAALAAQSFAAPQRTSDEVRRVIDAVLADPAYHKELESVEVNEGLFRALLKLLRKTLEWLRELGEGLADLRLSQPALFWIIMLAMFAVLALLLWHIAYSVSLAFRGTPKLAPEAAPEGGATLYFRRLWQRAEELAAAGDYTEAIRHLLLALLARIEAGKVALLPGWTNREIVARLRLDEERRGRLAGFVGMADRLWYGRRPASEEDYRRSQAVIATFLRSPAPDGKGNA
jgi:hypothetical protein